MEIVRAVLIAVEAIVSGLLIIIILLQKSKSEGLGLAFGANVGETLFGSRAGNVLTKLTIVLSIVFLANTLVLAMVFSGIQDRSLMHQYTAPQGRPAERSASRPATAPKPGGGAPTLPGTTFDDTAIPARAPSAIPAEPVMPVAAEGASAEPEPAP